MKMRVWAALAAMIVTSEAGAQTRPVADDLATGIGQVQRGELEVALVTLDGVVRRLKKEVAPAATLARAHLYLGVAYAGVRQWDRARTEMRQAWRLDRELTLDPAVASADAVMIYKETRREAGLESDIPGHGGGIGRPLLTALGVGAVGAGVVAANRPAGPPATPALPEALGRFTFVWGDSGECARQAVNTFVVPAEGWIHVLARWTPANYEFDLLLRSRSDNASAGSNLQTGDKGTTFVQVPVSPRVYEYELRYVSGCPERATGTVDIVFVPRQ